MLHKRLEIVATQLVYLPIELVQLVILEENRLDLVLEVVPTEVKGHEKLLVFSVQVVKDAGDQVTVRQVLKVELQPVVAPDRLILQAQGRVPSLSLQVIAAVVVNK